MGLGMSVVVVVAVLAFLGVVLSSTSPKPAATPIQMRVTATIRIPQSGNPTVRLEPTDASTDDLCLLVLCYASKIRWLLQHEWPVLEDVMRDSIASANALNAVSETQLWREAESAGTKGKAAVDGGEEFVVQFGRTPPGSATDTVGISNVLPNPGLVSNIVWSVLILLDNVKYVVGSDVEPRLRAALEEWSEYTYQHELPDRSLGALHALCARSLEIWEAG